MKRQVASLATNSWCDDQRNVGVGVHYRSLPEYAYYRELFGWMPEDYPAAAEIGRRTVSLPMSAKLSDAEVERVSAAVRATVQPTAVISF